MLSRMLSRQLGQAQITRLSWVLSPPGSLSTSVSRCACAYGSPYSGAFAGRGLAALEGSDSILSHL